MSASVNIHPKDPQFRVLVGELAEKQHTIKRIAALFRIDHRTLKKWMDEDVELRATYEKGLAEGQKNLMVALFDTAVTGKNPQVLIWLSKQFLDMKEPDKTVKIDDQTEAAGKRWLDIANTARDLKDAKAGGVPRQELAPVPPK